MNNDFKNLLKRNDFSTDSEGNLKFDLTEEEQKTVTDMFVIFKDYVFKPEIVKDFERGLTAYSIATLAYSDVEASNLIPNERINYLNSAVIRILKSYSIHPLPIYLYDSACFGEMLGKTDFTQELFRMYYNEQLAYKENEIDKLFLKERNINEALEDTILKLGIRPSGLASSLIA